MFILCYRTCHTGWSLLNGRCFKLFDGPLAKKDAEKDCQAKNSKLANANSEEKFNFLQTLVSDKSAFVRNFIFN